MSESAESLNPLTPRELEVLRHAACGRSNAQIALAMGIVEDTVKGLMARAMQRLHVHDRAHACSLLDDLYPGWRPSLVDRRDPASIAFRLRMIAAEVESPRSG